MDYKYIEQLLERYWQCQTTLEEEAILRAFFRQDDIPAALLPYRPLFLYEEQERESAPLGEAFDKKVFAALGAQKSVPAQHIPFSQRLRPLLKAAAIVAVVLTLSNALQMSLTAHKAATACLATATTDSAATQVATLDSLAIDSIHPTSLAPATLLDRSTPSATGQSAHE